MDYSEIRSFLKSALVRSMLLVWIEIQFIGRNLNVFHFTCFPQKCCRQKCAHPTEILLSAPLLTVEIVNWNSFFIVHRLNLTSKYPPTSSSSSTFPCIHIPCIHIAFRPPKIKLSVEGASFFESTPTFCIIIVHSRVKLPRHLSTPLNTSHIHGVVNDVYKSTACKKVYSRRTKKRASVLDLREAFTSLLSFQSICRLID